MNKFLELLDENLIYLECEVNSKETVIKRFIDHISQNSDHILDKEELYNQVIKKEQLNYSGVGHQLALIHARTNAVKDNVVAMAICTDGLDFHSKDQRLAKILILVASNIDNDSDYLTMLAQVSKIFHSDELIQTILNANSKQEIINIIKGRSTNRASIMV